MNVNGKNFHFASHLHAKYFFGETLALILKIVERWLSLFFSL